MAEITVVGCINRDVVSYVDRLPEAGETVVVRAVVRRCGGKGANQACQAALLYPPLSTKRVAMIGVVGVDEDADVILENLDRMNVDRTGVVRCRPGSKKSYPTGTAFITVDSLGENTIAYFPGANALLASHFENNDISRLLDGTKVVVTENGIQSDVQLAFLVEAKAKGCTTIFTPAPVDHVNSEVYRYIDYVVVNCVEARRILAGWNGGDAAYELGDATSIIKSLRERLLSVADKLDSSAECNIIMTNGAKPCVVNHKGRCSSVPVPVQFRDDEVVDTVGAGDSFAGSLAFFLSQGCEVIDAVSKACYVASQSTTRPGASESYVGRSDLPITLFATCNDTKQQM